MMTMSCRREYLRRLVLPIVLLGACRALGQPVGPDIVNSGFIDVQRYGTDAPGTTTAYAIGSTTCNHGDMPATVWFGSTIRPLVAQNMYRLKADASGAFQRFEQIGQSWVKRVEVPGQGSSATCGTCTPGPSGTMGVGCADVYSSGFNGSQGLLGPRSYINATTGASAGTLAPVGDAVTRGRIQVPTADVVSQPAGTRFFAETVMVLPDDAQYVRTGQTVAINALNNASSQEININAGTASPTLLGPGVQLVPAITRWQAIDPAVTIITVDHDDTPNPGSGFPGTSIRARFYVGVRITDLGAGFWRYEYAVSNLNSDRSAGSFTIPMPASAPLSAVTFHAPLYHSGEVYSNAPWSVSRPGDTLVFTTESYAANPNANAVRWGTMYNFGFTTPAPPTLGTGQLGLFKPGAMGAMPIPGLPVPTVRFCSPDFDGNVSAGDDQDIEAFFACLAGNCCLTCESGDFNGDGDFATDGDIESFFRVLAGGAC
jgi:hypothetical protein